VCILTSNLQYHHHWQNRPFSARFVYSWLCFSSFKAFCVPTFKSLFSFPGYRELDHPVFNSLDFWTVFFLQSKVISLASNPQPGGPGLCIHVPQWHGGPIIPSGTGFPFSRLLRLSRLQRKYCNPPSHESRSAIQLIKTHVHGASQARSFLLHRRRS
jgi:hypothetical protein